MPNHSDLLDRLRLDIAARSPVDERERHAIERTLALLGELPRPLDQGAHPTHVTGSAVVVGPPGVVLLRHRLLGIWMQPGGHLEPGEAPWEAALREAREETGLPAAHAAGADQPRLVHVDVHAGPRGHTHLDLRYLLAAPPDAPDPPAGESQAVAWFGWEDAIAMADDGLRGLLRALAPADPATVALRRAERRDAPHLAEIYLRSRSHALRGVHSPHADTQTRAWLAEHLLPEAEVWLAELAGVPVGLLALRGRWVDQLYLDPPWIGRGVGTRLLDLAKERSPEGLELWTFQVNAAARRFYARRGFDEVELTDGAGNEEREPDVRLAWHGGG